MPYIDEANRSLLAVEVPATTPGELNFQITTAVKCYLDYRGLSYSTINDILGALEGAKLEFYRRVAASHEEDKMSQNGDVY